ncbi:MAG TPA: hypothetical protein VN665_00930 [Candidatus Paceibacterota bacterium]|nr:hypothetical protein [Candidatus Paceibacterota bacterium]
MADIKALALSAASKLSSRNANSEADAIAKAIRGSGITHPADVKRLMREVGTQFARNKRDQGGFRGQSSRHQS